MPNYTITAHNAPSTPFDARTFIGETLTYRIDFTPWASENAPLTSASWRVVKGKAALSAQAFSSNVASANISFPEEGKSLIEVTATNGTLKKVAYISVLADDPDTEPSDYAD